MKIIFCQTVVFNQNNIFYFSDNVHFLKHFPIKVPQNYFDSIKCINQTVKWICKMSFNLDKSKNRFKVFVNCRSEIVTSYFYIRLQLTQFFKRIPLLIGTINLKIEPLITQNKYNSMYYISNLVQHPSRGIYNTLYVKTN